MVYSQTNYSINNNYTRVTELYNILFFRNTRYRDLLTVKNKQSIYYYNARYNNTKREPRKCRILYAVCFHQYYTNTHIVEVQTVIQKRGQLTGRMYLDGQRQCAHHGCGKILLVEQKDKIIFSNHKCLRRTLKNFHSSDTQ